MKLNPEVMSNAINAAKARIAALEAKHGKYKFFLAVSLRRICVAARMIRNPDAPSEIRAVMVEKVEETALELLAALTTAKGFSAEEVSKLDDELAAVENDTADGLMAMASMGEAAGATRH